MMRLATIVMAMAVAMPAMARDVAPQASVRPEPRPAEAPIDTAPPQTASPELPQKTDSGTEKPLAPKPGQRDLLRLNAAENAACLASLRDMAVVYEEVAALVPPDDADCGILQPIKVSEIAPGIALVPPAIIRCPTAVALAAWTQDFVLPAATRLSGRGALVAIENGSGYTCRRRNNLPGGELSEHAFGNAFDVMGFRFAQGADLVVGADKAQSGLASAFLDAVRAAACLDFTTVLGPGSNASHDNHLHFDIMARENGFRLCELSGTIKN